MEKSNNLPLISIQILNWNRAQDTQRAIESAINQSYFNIEIVVIDNGSTDNSVSLTKQNFPNIKVVELDKNYGCPGGRNKGIPHCLGDYIFYLDNDGVLHHKAVENAYKSIVAFENVGVVTGTIYDFDSEKDIDPSCTIKNPVQFYYNNFQGGICLHNKEIYKETGLYPSHFMYGSEESYMTYKLIDAGYNLVKDESVVLWHKRSDQARNRYKELEYSFFNRLYVAISIYPLFYAITFLLYFIPKYIYYSYREGFLKVFLRNYLKNLWKTLKLALKNRNPIKYSSYFRLRNFKSTILTQRVSVSETQKNL